MKIPVLHCENCGSANLRRSKRQSAWESLKMMAGIYPFRCLDCGARFWVSVWLFSKLAFAKCPKCLGTELVIWPAKHFRLTLFRKLMLTLGAQRYRCKPCRHNFLSFRPRLMSSNNQSGETEPDRQQTPVAE